MQIALAGCKGLGADCYESIAEFDESVQIGLCVQAKCQGYTASGRELPEDLGPLRAECKLGYDDGARSAYYAATDTCVNGCAMVECAAAFEANPCGDLPRWPAPCYEAIHLVPRDGVCDNLVEGSDQPRTE